MTLSKLMQLILVGTVAMKEFVTSMKFQSRVASRTQTNAFWIDAAFTDGSVQRLLVEFELVHDQARIKGCHWEDTIANIGRGIHCDRTRANLSIVMINQVYGVLHDSFRRGLLR